MHIPNTLNIVQYHSSTLNCIRYVDFLSRRQETVNILSELALQYPNLYQEHSITRACYDVAFAQRQDDAQRNPLGIHVKAVEVPNTPSNQWEVLGSDGHDCHLIHPTWGIWTLANNEVLYLQATKPLSEQMFQFYVKDGILKLGIASEIQEKIASMAHTPFVSVNELTEEDIGRVILYGTRKYLVLAREPSLQIYELPNLKPVTISTSTPTFDNGYQQLCADVQRTEIRYPTLAAFGAAHPGTEVLEWKAEQLKHIVEHQLASLLSEVFQIRKRISFSWECRGLNRDANNLVRFQGRTPMALPEKLAEILCEETIAELPSRLFISIHKVVKAVYELTITGAYPGYSNKMSLDEIVEMLTQTIQIHNISFVEGTTFIQLNPD